ncbi:MAG: hypothetical protein II313_05860, partial [Anaerotignum sp.]|nr:hypothetical protein [Anaerotignum sp.]
AEYMPEEIDSFADGLNHLLIKSINQLMPDLDEAVGLCTSVLATVVLLAALSVLSPEIQSVITVGGVVVVSSILLRNTNSMIQLAAEVVREITEYGKLLCPVMASALAAQGAVTSAAALYSGAVVFSTVLYMLISELLIPMIYLFLVFSIAGCAFGEEILRKLSDLIKSGSVWLLKTLLIVYTTYMSITGVVSGGTDAASLKAAKIAISTTVPVVGGILADASEAVIHSVNVMKNAAGVYGILAVLALFLKPFLQVGVHCLVLKLFTALYGVFGNKQINWLTEDFAAALSLLLAMVGSGCLSVLVSTVCFLKGAG